MKKTIVILAIIISTTAFSKNHPVDHSIHKKSGKSQMTKQVSDLNHRQQKEYKVIHERTMADMKKNKLAIKEIDIQIRKEKHNKRPNIKKINKLTNKKSRLQAKQEKKMLRFKLEVKDKFGIKIMGGMMSKGENCNRMTWKA
ncbi:hypothetical protein [uncultured Ilyobacter sp.]|uniref:hypothetical protein n=1 Tax=uncultured Ilyobacter sp. TaxID=544433 RepID=UPI0029F4AEB6|nr:hypothetical protein [uncultured Ilyobacter sp.]